MQKYVNIAKSLAEKCGDDSTKLFVSLGQLYALGCRDVNRDAPDRRTKILRSRALLRSLVEAVGLEWEADPALDGPSEGATPIVGPGGSCKVQDIAPLAMSGSCKN